MEKKRITFSGTVKDLIERLNQDDVPKDFMVSFSGECSGYIHVFPEYNAVCFDYNELSDEYEDEEESYEMAHDIMMNN